MFPKLASYWHSLPASVKTIVVIFLGASTGVLKHALEAPNVCVTVVCLKGYAISAGHAGFIAVLAYLMPSPLNRPQPPAAPAEAPKQA